MARKEKPLNRFDDYRSWKNPLVSRGFCNDAVCDSIQDVHEDVAVAISHYLNPKEEKARLKAVNFIWRNLGKDVRIKTREVDNLGTVYGILPNNRVLVIRGLTITQHEMEDLVVLEM